MSATQPIAVARLWPTVARVAVPLVLLAIAGADAQVRVIDMIPRRFGNEIFQNAEPTLAVNPVNPAVMAASAYTLGGDICSRAVEAPIFVTRDTGRTWSIVCKILVDSSALLPPGDVMLRWSAHGRFLYATLLWPFNPYTLQIFQTDDPFGPSDFMQVGVFPKVDQPDLAAIPLRPPTVGQAGGAAAGGGDAWGTRLFISGNFMSGDTALGRSSEGTAGVVVIPPQPAKPVPIERRKIAGENYATRLGAHESGVVYALFYSPRPSPNGNFVIEDVVIVRDDSAGISRSPFTALLDTPIVKGTSPKGCDGHDGKPGIQIVTCRVVPYAGGARSFGFQRRVSANLSLAVDPDDPKTVWVAWADSMAKDHYTLHVRRSKDGGRSWSADLVTIQNATNPALAAGNKGNIGFLFQALEQSPSGMRWVTRLYTSTNGFQSRRSYLLATTDALNPLPVMQPYIGDYAELRAVGDRFYGVFSASNLPDTLNFPNGVAFQRLVDLQRKIPLNEHGGFTIGISIDPFFFAVGPAVHPECAANTRFAARPPMFAMIGRDSTRRGRALEIGCPP